MFKSEGTFPVVITRAIIAESKFNAGVMSVNVEVSDGNGATDWWCGDWSAERGKGNASDKMQWEMTLATLKKIGFSGDDVFAIDANGNYVHLRPDENQVATIPELIGKSTVATTKASEPNQNGKVYYNVRYLGEGGGPKGMTLNDISKIFGRQPAAVQQPAPQPQPAPAPTAAPGAIPAFPGAAPAAPNGPFANLKR